MNVKLTPDMVQIAQILEVRSNCAAALLDSYLEQCAISLGLKPESVRFDAARAEFIISAADGGKSNADE